MRETDTGLGRRWVPWPIAEEAYPKFRRLCRQQGVTPPTLTELADQGGFWPLELDLLLSPFESYDAYVKGARTEAEGNMIRASGLVQCSKCGLFYFDHPTSPFFEFLNRSCEGTLLKL